jgi:hypothetical protein
MLRRDEKFRKDFFGMEGINLTAPVSPEHIHVEKHLGEHGRADILIDSPDILMLIEVKTALGCQVTGKQHIIASEAGGYISYLLSKSNGKPDVRLVYLVPKGWNRLAETRLELENYKASGGINISVAITHWEDITSLTQGDEQRDGLSLVDEFHLVLAERFGPTTFSQEELQLMNASGFPLEVFLKLIKLVDEVRIDIDPKIKLHIHKDEFGFYTDKEERRYFGCWLEIWRRTGDLLCFGIQNAHPSEEAAFVSSLFTLCGTDPIKEGSWVMGVIPDGDIYSSSAPAKSISEKIQGVFSSI